MLQQNNNLSFSAFHLAKIISSMLSFFSFLSSLKQNVRERVVDRLVDMKN
jgi:hypothetical protein